MLCQAQNCGEKATRVCVGLASGKLYSACNRHILSVLPENGDPVNSRKAREAIAREVARRLAEK